MKNHKFFILIMILLTVSFSFAYAQQTSEQDFMKQISKSMTIDNTPDTSNEKSPTININYWSYVKIIIVLALVIAAIYAIFHFLKKALKIKENVGEDAQIITSQVLGPGKWLQVVYIHGKYLILGVTNENINLIGEITDPKEIEQLDIYSNQQAVQKGKTFQDLFTDLKNQIFGRKERSKENFDYETDEVDFLKKQQKRINDLNTTENDNDEQ